MSVINDRLGKQAAVVSKDIQAMGGIIKDAAQKTLGQLRDNASERYEQGRGGVQNAMATSGRFVRDRPIQSVLVAGLIGLLLGRFWQLRFHDDSGPIKE